MKNVYDGIMSVVDSREDTDRLLSYFTRQQVQFLDRKLGITFYLINLLIAAYIVGYMFIYEKGYLEFEQAKGAVVTHVYGDAFAVSTGKAAERYFSTEELTYPGLENGNVFIASRLTVNTQKRGVCEDLQMPCSADSDCSSFVGGTCTTNGFCMERSWCSSTEEKPEIYEMDTGNLQVWTRSTIQFVKIAPKRVYSTEMEDPSPKSGYNTFTIRELLLKCEPLPVRYEEVAELGAIIEVQFFWECGVKAKVCHPTVKARRLDTLFDPDNIGFKLSYPEFIDENTRLQNEVRGIRMFFRTVGLGKKISVAATVSKASLGAALFTLAQVIVDLLLVKFFGLRNKYKARKFENTPDFSEYMDKVNAKKKDEVTEAQIEEEELKVIKKEQDWIHKLDESEV